MDLTGDGRSFLFVAPSVIAGAFLLPGKTSPDVYLKCLRLNQ